MRAGVTVLPPAVSNTSHRFIHPPITVVAASTRAAIDSSRRAADSNTTSSAGRGGADDGRGIFFDCLRCGRRAGTKEAAVGSARPGWRKGGQRWALGER